MNVTGIEFGNLEAGTPSLAGGTNLPLEFLSQVDVNSGGYQAEYGGGMGGVINSVLKSGSNASTAASSDWSPYLLAGDPERHHHCPGSAIGGVRSPTSTPASASRSAARSSRTSCSSGRASRRDFRTGTSSAKPMQFRTETASRTELPSVENTTARAHPETRQVPTPTRATVDFIVSPEHRLTVGLSGPSTNDQLRSFNRRLKPSPNRPGPRALTK